MKIGADGDNNIRLPDIDSMDWLAATLSDEIISIGNQLKNQCRTREIRKLKILSKLLNYPDGRFYDAIDILLENNGVVVTSMIQNEISAINRQTVQKYLDELVQVKALNRINLSDLQYDLSEIDAICLRAHVYYINKDILETEIYNILDYFKNKRKQNFSMKAHKPKRPNLDKKNFSENEKDQPLLLYQCLTCGWKTKETRSNQPKQLEKHCPDCRTVSIHKRVDENED